MQYLFQFELIMVVWLSTVTSFTKNNINTRNYHTLITKKCNTLFTVQRNPNKSYYKYDNSFHLYSTKENSSGSRNKKESSSGIMNEPSADPEFVQVTLNPAITTKKARNVKSKANNNTDTTTNTNDTNKKNNTTNTNTPTTNSINNNSAKEIKVEKEQEVKKIKETKFKNKLFKDKVIEGNNTKTENKNEKIQSPEELKFLQTMKLTNEFRKVTSGRRSHSSSVLVISSRSSCVSVCVCVIVVVMSSNSE